MAGPGGRPTVAFTDSLRTYDSVNELRSRCNVVMSFLDNTILTKRSVFDLYLDSGVLLVGRYLRMARLTPHISGIYDRMVNVNMLCSRGR
jgi:hypothetical protein